jgi:hypothetical protein
MEKIIFTWLSSVDDARTPMLAASIREFAGSFSNSPIWVIFPNAEKDIPDTMKQRLSSLDIEIISMQFDFEWKKFPFAVFVAAAAKFESMVKRKAELLAWLTPDTLIINEPSEFLLDTRKFLAYRPVHHTLIGSPFEDEIDPFWEAIYYGCEVSLDDVFPMKTHVDGNILRPYFNAGCLITKPERNIFQMWWNRFQAIYQRPEIRQFYGKSRLYEIFVHQAILSAVILSALQQTELQELPFTYNYPLHLYSESSPEYRPADLNELVTARYEHPKWLDQDFITDPLKSWLRKNEQLFS